MATFSESWSWCQTTESPPSLTRVCVCVDMLQHKKDTQPEEQQCSCGRDSPTTLSPVWTPIFLMAAAYRATSRRSSPYVTFTISSFASAGEQKWEEISKKERFYYSYSKSYVTAPRPMCLHIIKLHFPVKVTCMCVTVHENSRVDRKSREQQLIS